MTENATDVWLKTINNVDIRGKLSRFKELSLLSIDKGIDFRYCEPAIFSDEYINDKTAQYVPKTKSIVDVLRLGLEAMDIYRRGVKHMLAEYQMLLEENEALKIQLAEQGE